MITDYRLLTAALLPQRFEPAQARRPALLNHLAAAAKRQGLGRHVLRDHRAGTDIGALPDLDRRHQRRVRANEGATADVGAVLGGTVVIAGDRAGADIGIGAN